MEILHLSRNENCKQIFRILKKDGVVTTAAKGSGASD